MSQIILIPVAVDDALIVGIALRTLARSNHAPDPSVSARLFRVGEQMAAAAKVEQVVALARVRGERGVL